MTTSRSLSPAHREQLRASVIGDEEIKARGYWTATSADVEAVKKMGFPAQIVESPALMLPVHDVYESVAFTIARPDRPLLDARGRPKKYQFPRGASPTLDVPPRARAALKDLDTPLLIVEGQKKGDAAVSAGAGCCIVLLGVWSWKKITALGVWDEVALRRRLVRLAFDSDVSRNEKVHLALRRIRAFLKGRGAEVLIIPLEDQPDGRKMGLDDALASGISLDQLYGMASPELHVHRRDAKDTRPDLNVTILERGIVNEAFDRLVKGGAVYRTPTGLVRIENDDGVMTVRPLTAPQLRAVLDHTVRCTRVVGEVLIPCLPPRDLAELMANDPEPLVPELRGVVTSPTFTADGRWLSRPGYDSTSKLFLALSVLVPPVPVTPSPTDIAEARRWWDFEALCDFPFDTPADRTAAMAFALTPLVRERIDGPSPMFDVEAPAAGSGKGLLVKVALTPTQGPSGWTSAALPKEDEELRKALTAYLSQRRRAIVFENVPGSIRSAVLAKVLTDRDWDDRVLGRTESVRLPVQCTWAATVNNPSYSGEIARRLVPIRLVPDVDHPELRTGFRHPELETWVMLNRGQLLWALAVMVRAWQAADCPMPAVRPLGSYEVWTRVIGGILEVVGYPDFLANRAKILAAGDPDTETWSAFITGWWDRHGSQYMTVRDLVGLAEEHGVTVNGDSDKAKTTSLGRAFSARRDRFFGGRRLEQGQGQARRQWRILTPDATSDTSYPTHLRVTHARAPARPEGHLGEQVAEVAGGVTDPVQRAWALAREAEDKFEREAIVGEGAP